MNNEKIYTGASLTLSILEQQGVTDIFGYPGGAIMPIYDAIYDSPVKHYLCRHEQGAAFAAVGYARASGKVGVCMATSGPGATNLLTGLADAMADSIAIVAITGQVGTKAMGTDGFQEVDIIGLSLACTKHCFQVRNIDQLAEYLTQAFQIAQNGRPGPVLIDIPKDIQMTHVENILNLISENKMTEHQTTQQSDQLNQSFQQAAELISQSQKPILYIGGGVGMANAVDELTQLIKITQIPSVVTLKALGCVKKNQPHYLGMLGMHGTKAANLAVQDCDLLMVVGARFDDRVTGKLNEFAPHAKVIHMDIDPAEIGKRRQADIALIDHLKNSLPKLIQAIDPDRLNINTWQEQCRNLISENKLNFNFKQNKQNQSKNNIFAPALLRELSDTISDSAIVTTDVGQHQMWAAQTMRFNHPSQFITSSGLGTMGFGIPAAIGAQISSSKTQVITVSGDGSFMMNVQELATIKRYKLPIKIVLIDNGRLGMVRQWQELFFKRRYSETDLSDNPDFVTLATAFAIKAKMITKMSEVTSAIDEMLNHQGAYLLQVKIDAMDNVWPLVPPETSNSKMIEQTTQVEALALYHIKE